MQAELLTVAGPSPAFAAFRDRLEDAGVAVTVVEDADRPVYLKERFVVDGRKLLKVDRGRPLPISTRTAARLAETLRARVGHMDAFVVSDFGYGLVGAGLCRAIADIAAETGRPYAADVSTASAANLGLFTRPTLVAPTEHELRMALADPDAGLSVLASRYYARSRAEGLVITLGSRGAVSFGPPRDDAPLRTDYLPALSRGPARDPVGAGDVFLSLAAASRFAGGPLAHGLYLASCAAAMHVDSARERPGGPDVGRAFRRPGAAPGDAGTGGGRVAPRVGGPITVPVDRAVEQPGTFSASPCPAGSDRAEPRPPGGARRLRGRRANSRCHSPATMFAAAPAADHDVAGARGHVGPEAPVEAPQVVDQSADAVGLDVPRLAVAVGFVADYRLGDDLHDHPVDELAVAVEVVLVAEEAIGRGEHGLVVLVDLAAPAGC